MAPVVFPDMDRLATFLAVVETGSFRKAAAFRFLSHSTVQKQMRSLERDIGFELFERSGRNVVIRSRGHDLAEAVRPAVNACMDLHDAIEQLRTTTATTLRIGTVPVHIANRLGVAIRMLQSAGVHAEAVLLSANQMEIEAELVRLLESAAVDTIVTVRKLPGCRSANLWPVELVAVTPDEFIDTKRRSLPLEALTSATVFAQDTNMWSRQQLDRLNSTEVVSIVTEPLPDVCLSLARAGLGVAVVANDNVPSGTPNVFRINDRNGRAVRDHVRANWLTSEKRELLRDFLSYFSGRSGAA